MISQVRGADKVSAGRPEGKNTWNT